jgi:hypothetical protein
VCSVMSFPLTCNISPLLSVLMHVSAYSHMPLVFLVCVSTAAGVLLFADVWTCTDASQIPMTDLDRWLQHGPSSIERIASLEEIGLLLFPSRR